MPKLNQINALVTGKKTEATAIVTEAYKLIQKEQLFNGRERVYRPSDEEHGEKLPSESQKVQQTAKALLAVAQAKWIEIWDLVATQDAGNQLAKADVTVDGKTVLPAIPVTTLLYLEKQVNDVETYISKLPTPDPSEVWDYDATTSLLRSLKRETQRTQKEPSSFTKAPATKEHAAQVEFFFKDVPVGTWSQTLFSGAIQADLRNLLLDRVRRLKDAIKVAREQANLQEIAPASIGKLIFNYLLAGTPFGK